MAWYLFKHGDNFKFTFTFYIHREPVFYLLMYCSQRPNYILRYSRTLRDIFAYFPVDGWTHHMMLILKLIALSLSHPSIRPCFLNLFVSLLTWKLRVQRLVAT
jgi:hypothetical protein